VDDILANADIKEILMIKEQKTKDYFRLAVW